MVAFSMPARLNVLLKTVVLAGAIVLSFVWYRNHRTNAPEIVVCSTPADWESVSSQFLQQASDGFLGVDCEWVNSRAGAKKVALLQLAPSSKLCVLVRLCRMEIPQELKKVLEDPNIMKFGVAVMDDAKKLYNDYGIMMYSCLDLRYMALENGYEWNGTQGLSLAVLASHYANYPLNKSSRVRLSNWEAKRLSKEQIDYAARDAFAAIRIVTGLLRNSELGPLFDSCFFEYFPYLDIPFRKAAAKAKTRQTQVKRANPSSRRPATRSDQKVYKNAVMKAPDGEVLCNTDTVKTEWYLKMNLATLESEDPLVIRLKFEPRCRAVLGGEFYTDEKQNICVVCGSERALLKKNVIPLEYRKLFPALLKSHTSHDSVLICVNCQDRATVHDTKFRAVLESECENRGEIQMPAFQTLKRAARALRSAGDKLPEARKEHFRSLLESHYNEPLNERIIDDALSVDEHKWKRENGLTHAQRVFEKYSQTEGLFALESRFRQHFLDTMRPEYLSPKWSIFHNHDAVLMKMATGRYVGPMTYDEFLKLVGATWERVGDLVTTIVKQGIIRSNQVVVWEQLRNAGFEIPHNDMQPSTSQPQNTD